MLESWVPGWASGPRGWPPSVRKAGGVPGDGWDAGAKNQAGPQAPENQAASQAAAESVGRGGRCLARGGAKNQARPPAPGARGSRESSGVPGQAELAGKRARCRARVGAKNQAGSQAPGGG